MTSPDVPAEKKRAFDTYQARVEESVVLTPRNKNIRFKFLDGKTMHFKAGQFVQIFVPDGEKPRRTSYSIASAPQMTDGFELCVTLVDGGKSSTFLHSLKPGDVVQAMGPLGKFTMPEPLARDVAFVCTGSGVAPFRSMIHDLLQRGVERRLNLVFGNRYLGDIIYEKDWEEVAAKHPNFRFLFTLSRPSEAWKGEKGYVQEKIEKLLEDPKAHDFYICGLNNMITAVTEKLKALGVPEGQIHFERYD
jgi:ferredoxin-NADP reductase